MFYKIQQKKMQFWHNAILVTDLGIHPIELSRNGPSPIFLIKYGPFLSPSFSFFWNPKSHKCSLPANSCRRFSTRRRWDQPWYDKQTMFSLFPQPPLSFYPTIFNKREEWKVGPIVLWSFPTNPTLLIHIFHHLLLFY